MRVHWVDGWGKDLERSLDEICGLNEKDVVED